MIDFRHLTFLALCELKNYTKTAEFLHLTQPAITQHIQYLENYYGGKLINLSKGNFQLTKKGNLLKHYTQIMVADSKIIFEKINNSKDASQINFGATLTIGEFIMPQIINKIMLKNDYIHFNLIIENTKSLLNRLENSEITFAFIEGIFDKSKYSYNLFKKENFIAVCSPKSTFAQGKHSIENLISSKLILREKGSGTRDIFEQILHSINLTPQSFLNVSEIGNMNAIKTLVEENCGITFLYEAAVKEELLSKKLVKIDLINFNIKRELNFVYLKNSIHSEEYNKTFNLFKNFI